MSADALSRRVALAVTPRFLLVAVCVVIIIIAAGYTGHSVPSMDGRTYAQMIRGVAEHGLPYWDNGPIDRFPELVVQWGTPRDGHIWGIYSPLYPYVAAPAFRIDGIVGVSRFTFALLVPLVVTTFLLAKRFVESEWYALLAAVLVVVSTGITGHSLELTPFTLTTVLVTLGMYFTARMLESPSPQAGTADAIGLPVLCGITWAAAGSAHILSLPMAMAALVVVAVARPRDGEDPLRARAARLAPMLFGFGFALLPAVYLNHLRFDSFNPISYGPIPWTGDVNGQGNRMTLVAQARYSAIAVIFTVVAASAIALARRRWRGKPALVAAVIASFVLVAFAVPPLRERFIKYAMIACGYVVDMTVIDMGPAYPRAEDGLGRVFAGWIVKSTLQCTPVVVLAPLALLGSRERNAQSRRWPIAVILVPIAALYLSLLARANSLTYADALGWPWVHIRYTFPALPGLLVASVVVLERLRPTWRSLAGAVVVAALVLPMYVVTPFDTVSWKRFMVVVVPVLLAAVTMVVTVANFRAQAVKGAMKGAARLAPALVAITIGLGIAIGLGHDLRASYAGKRYVQSVVDNFVDLVPQRFALVGRLGEFDAVLTTAVTHDVQYADLSRLDRYSDIHSLLEHWRSEARPTYFLAKSEPPSPWPGVAFELVGPLSDAQNLYLVKFRPRPEP